MVKQPSSRRKVTAAILEQTEKCLLNPLGKNKRSVWSVPTQSVKGAHFCDVLPALIEPCILAGCPVDGVVLDPFGGSGTTVEWQ